MEIDVKLKVGNIEESSLGFGGRDEDGRWYKEGRTVRNGGVTIQVILDGASSVILAPGLEPSGQNVISATDRWLEEKIHNDYRAKKYRLAAEEVRERVRNVLPNVEVTEVWVLDAERLYMEPEKFRGVPMGLALVAGRGDHLPTIFEGSRVVKAVSLEVAKQYGLPGHREGPVPVYWLSS